MLAFKCFNNSNIHGLSFRNDWPFMLWFLLLSNGFITLIRCCHVFGIWHTKRYWLEVSKKVKYMSVAWTISKLQGLRLCARWDSNPDRLKTIDLLCKSSFLLFSSVRGAIFFWPLTLNVDNFKMPLATRSQNTFLERSYQYLSGFKSPITLKAGNIL